jgi:hypothetical protein
VNIKEEEELLEVLCVVMRGAASLLISRHSARKLLSRGQMFLVRKVELEER